VIFKNRQEAGVQLGHLLKGKLPQEKAIVIGLPRGGVIVAAEVAKVLALPLDILCPRKIGAPANPELAIGAIGATGTCFLSQRLIEEMRISQDYLKKKQEEQIQEAKRRMQLYRQGKPPLLIKGQSVILVDDGLATGATMRVAILEAKHLQAKRVFMAVPVAPTNVFNELSHLTDGSYCLQLPQIFYAVGEFYRDFDQVTDQEVTAVLFAKK
jgi:putative phosphoribosyl transferase